MGRRPKVRLPRRPKSPDATNPNVQPVVIQPTGVFRPEQLSEALGLCRTAVLNECRRGRLRRCKVSGKVFVLGRWVLEWMRRREAKRGEAGRRELPAPRRRLVGRHRRRVAPGRGGGGDLSPAPCTPPAQPFLSALPPAYLSGAAAVAGG
jgi:hypothetical protein